MNDDQLTATAPDEHLWAYPPWNSGYRYPIRLPLDDAPLACCTTVQP